MDELAVPDVPQEQVTRAFPILEQLDEQTRKVEALCTAAQLVLESGGETYRVEETVLRMAKGLGLEDVNVVAFPTSIFVETQGLTYIEAMASGLCVVAAKDPCLNGVIEDGVSGVLCGDSDDELLEALLRAFSDEGLPIAKHAPASALPFGREAFARKAEACYLKAISGEA